MKLHELFSDEEEHDEDYVEKEKHSAVRWDVKLLNVNLRQVELLLLCFCKKIRKTQTSKLLTNHWI